MPRLHRLSWLWLVLLGCRNVVDIPAPNGPLPVIEALLVAGTSQTTIRLVRVAPLGEDDPNRQEPIPPAEVALTLADLAGGSAPLVAVPDTVALFEASLPILAGHRYRLSGVIADQPVDAVTTVPAAFQIQSPATDPIPAASPDPIAFRWTSSGATAYLTDAAVFGRTGLGHTRETAGEFRIRPGDPGEPRQLRIWALNRDAENYLLNYAIPQSNVSGGSGMLGGAIEVRRNLSWQ